MEEQWSGRDFTPIKDFAPFPPTCDWAVGCVCPRRVGEVVQNAVECVLLVELDVGVAVTVLHADDDLLAALYIGHHRHPGAVSEHALVGPTRVPLLGLEELVVEVKVVDPAGNQLSAPDSHIDQQSV